MAAQKLDKLWDGWAIALSRSHEKTLRLLEAGKKAEARSEFRDRFLVTVKEIYSEAAVVSPERFSKSKNWSAWLRHLYALSITAEKSLRPGVRPSDTPRESTTPRDEAKSTLEKLRAHFCQLRSETETRKSNDYLHAFHRETMKEEPAASKLKALRADLEKAVPSLKAKADPKTFQEAKNEWAKRIDPILADDTVAPPEIEPLRSATRFFYRAYGVQVE